MWKIEDFRRISEELRKWGASGSINEAENGRAVERGLERREKEPIGYVGIDEKSFGRWHDFVSVMTDIKGGRVLDVVPSRDQAAVDQLMDTLSYGQRAEVHGVVMDMWPAYMNAAKKALPEAVLVHDKFHVSEHLNEAVDKVRKQEHAQLMAKKNERLKGSRYLWLKGFENMSPEASGGSTPTALRCRSVNTHSRARNRYEYVEQHHRTRSRFR